MHPLIETRQAEIQGLCRRLGIRRLDLFGSATSDAFDLDSSDVDVLVEFDAGRDGFDYYGTYFALKEGLECLLGRARFPGNRLKRALWACGWAEALPWCPRRGCGGGSGRV
ncbi:putative nucleotidyltransferase [Frankia casuarinae]|jgi:predicted nucleotidyltransferase|uniref:Polymerase nucleotidyl transferase domain-containing protein n=1 Tax=Frankia casuarinae (strain DSM 45818 / CECT 9043 / HFP020203 / CcI3) TaxID=106370 RepID=Q2JAY7_FRACC|nr:MULTISPECIES: nucleotidyltransferase domain-containing protein [Frankia]ABD11555.1 hypothetical protein Francci3_2185 [Frankia casuarinae]EYT91605.1 putative nucleotidyltransferase [Frankia casuarinae]KEZ34944.1 nucleotidyltransferase family protein [Frankia sp. CeD]